MSRSTASSSAPRTTSIGWIGVVTRPQMLIILLPCVVAFLQLAYFLIDINRHMNVHDEGVILYGTSRILNGDVPYRDFWMTGYGPGQFYVLAQLFQIFGPSIYVERLYDIAVRLAIGVVFYLIMRKMTTPRVAALWWLVITMELLSPWLNYGYVTFPALLFYLLTVLFLLSYFAAPHIKWIIPVALSSSLVAAF